MKRVGVICSWFILFWLDADRARLGCGPILGGVIDACHELRPKQDQERNANQVKCFHLRLWGLNSIAVFLTANCFLNEGFQGDGLHIAEILVVDIQRYAYFMDSRAVQRPNASFFVPILRPQ